LGKEGERRQRNKEELSEEGKLGGDASKNGLQEPSGAQKQKHCEEGGTEKVSVMVHEVGRAQRGSGKKNQVKKKGSTLSNRKERKKGFNGGDP